MKRKLIIGIILFSLPATQHALAGFPDVQVTHLHHDAIIWAQEEGIVQGFPDSTFGPDQTINRAEFLKVLLEAVNVRFSAPCDEGIFPDVSPGDWFVNYTLYAKCHGIISGYPDGTFRPANEINFAEAAKIIANVLGIAEEQQTNPWHEQYVIPLRSHSAIPPSIANADHNVTRGEMTEIIYRLREKIVNAPSPSLDSYTNDQYGYSFHYPIHWTLVERPDGASTLTSQIGENMSIHIQNNPDRLSVLEWIFENFPLPGASDFKRIEYNGIEGFQNETGVVHLRMSDDKIFTATCQNYSGPGSTKCVMGYNDFLVILGTLRFQLGEEQESNKEKAFFVLNRAFESKSGECKYFEKECMSKMLTSEEQIDIALAFNVIEESTTADDVRFGLLRGSSIVIPGIGAAYTENKKLLNIEDDKWYWEVGNCSTNKRMYIEAESGRESLLHQHIYCGGVY